jgi:hypothetical protein
LTRNTNVNSKIRFNFVYKKSKTVHLFISSYRFSEDIRVSNPLDQDKKKGGAYIFPLLTNPYLQYKFLLELILSKIEYFWTDNDKIKFLKIVERFPDIYNHFDPNYRNSAKKKHSYTIVVNLMKLPSFDVALRLHKIRREINAAMQGVNVDTLYENPLMLAAKFLIECIRRKEMIEAFEVIFFLYLSRAF